jgi:hypothetical protein
MDTPTEHPDAPQTEREVALQIELAEAKASVYVPGAWHCDKCGFDLTKSILHARSGNIGADLGQHVEPCPNDGNAMRRTTWKEDAMMLADRSTVFLERATNAEKELEFVRQTNVTLTRLKLEAQDRIEVLDRDRRLTTQSRDALLVISKQAQDRATAAEALIKEIQSTCEHKWEKVDASFSHEFGTEVIRYMQCEKCGKHAEGDDVDDGPDEPPERDPDYDAERPPTPLENWRRNDEHRQ